LYGQSARRIQSERRASGEFVHIEATPGYVTIVPAWKLDAVYCAGLKRGEPGAGESLHGGRLPGGERHGAALTSPEGHPSPRRAP